MAKRITFLNDAVDIMLETSKRSPIRYLLIIKIIKIITKKVFNNSLN